MRARKKAIIENDKWVPYASVYWSGFEALNLRAPTREKN
jgi:hypothetical protein